VTCDVADLKPAADKVKGSQAVRSDAPLAHPSGAAQHSSPAKKRGDKVNLWRDVATREVSEAEGPWNTTTRTGRVWNAEYCKYFAECARLLALRTT